MPKGRRDKGKWGFYTCGRCKGEINFLLNDGPPEYCTECGYGYSPESPNNVPDVFRMDLNKMHNVGTARYGKLEKTTIVHR